ncbi:MAG TPA: ATP-binding protein, partial [Opitutus sp.]|nr:ATP-binding protein [Opitutus sp.]
GRLALAGADVEALFQEAMTLLAQTLEVEFGRVLELQASGEKLLLRAGIGWRDGLVGRATIDADAEEQAGFTLQGDGPVVVEDLGAEARFAAALLREHGVVSGVTVLIQGRRKPWGVLGAHTARRRAFGQHEVAFLQTMAHVLGEAIERKATEAALHESDARFHQVVENVAEALWMFEPETKRVVYVSPRYAEIWGRTGPSVDDAPPGWHESIHPDDRAAVQKAAVVRERAEGESQTYRIVRPDGAVRWIRHRTFAARDEAGKVRRLIAVAEDTTEQKKLEEQFLRAQRMEAIGTLAGGVAHDLNNMLTPVLMTADLLTERLGDERDRRLLAVMARSAQRAADTVKQLLLFSRGAEGARTLVQCQQLLKEMVAIMRETFPREITIVEHPASDLRPVVADATHLHQVLMNLCVNARDAMPNGGTLTVGGTNVELGPRDLHLHADARCGRYTVLTVADTGRGIPPEISNRIFDPFFTTKEVGRGSGLGLSTAVGILRSHGGFITVWSESGRGTVFRCHLPAAGQSALAALPPPATPALAPAGSGEVILVVDDEEPVREAIREILELNKYRVLLAADGREAMGRFLEQRENVRLVLTDLMMPVMNGAALVRALRAL